jgi:hypothetical protein
MGGQGKENMGDNGFIRGLNQSLKTKPSATGKPKFPVSFKYVEGQNNAVKYDVSLKFFMS